MELTTRQKGALAEAKIAAAAVEQGWFVLRPDQEGRRYDFVFDVDHRLLRIQCKWARVRGDVVIAQTGTCRHTPAGYVRSTYSPADIDVIALYCGELDRCFALPVTEVTGLHAIHLRLAPARNGQRSGVRLADAYPLGAVAQLGERRHGMAEVRGSSPLSSIATKAA